MASGMRPAVPPPPPPAMPGGFSGGFSGGGFSGGADFSNDAVGNLIDTAAVQAAQQAAQSAQAQREAQLQREVMQRLNPPTRSLRVDQQFVGFVIGPNGSNLQQVRDSCGLINIQIDQTTKEQGFSIVQLFGPQDGADRAAQMIEGKLAEIDPKRKPQGAEDMRIDQVFVGFILGKGGETLKAIKARSGATIAVDQSTKEQGFSTVRVMGDEPSKRAALELVEGKINEARSKQCGGGGGPFPFQGGACGGGGGGGFGGGCCGFGGKGGGGCGCGGGFGGGGGGGFGGPQRMDLAAHEVRVEQGFVGWLIGKGGETVRLIKEQTGSTVVIDQSTKDQGYSTVRIQASPGADHALAMIEQKLSQVDALGNNVQEIQVDQQVVGLLIGRGGETVRQIKDMTGASMSVNQSTRDAGYSIVRLSGSPDAIARAARLIVRKTEEMHPGGPSPHVSAAEAMQASGSRGGSRDFGAVPPPSFGAVPPPSFGAVPPPSGGDFGPKKFGAVPPPNFGAVPPPSFGSVPPPSFGAVPPPSFNAAPPPFSAAPFSTEVYDPFTM